MRTVRVPQLAVAQFQLHEPRSAQQLFKSLDPTFISSYNQRLNSGVIYSLLSKDGGSFVFENTEYIYRPIQSCSTRPEVRLLIAVPSDYALDTSSKRFVSLVKRVKLTALIAQSVIANALRERYGNKDDQCLTFHLAEQWTSRTAEVPCESRTFSGATHVHLSDAVSVENDEMVGSVGVLRSDKTTAELFGTKNMAAHFIKCIDLLNARDPGRIVNLIFVPYLLNEDLASHCSEKFETKRDVSVISSQAIEWLPISVSEINAILKCTDQLEDVTCRSLPRIIERKVLDGKCVLRHTMGGAVCSLLGAVIHELGHLFKLPHTPAGIMRTGGDNVHTLFLSDPLINLAFNETKSAHNAKDSQMFSGDRMMAFGVDFEESIKTCVRDSHFDEVSLDLLHWSHFINWVPDTIVHAIVYDRKSRLLRSTAGIVRVAWFSALPGAHFISYSKYQSLKELALPFVSDAKILAVANDGNSAIFAL